MKFIKPFVLFAAAAFLGGCANDDDYGTPDLSGNCVELTANKQVSEVLATASATMKEYTEDDIIEAYVTSSDEGGNFYKSISMVSTDGAIGFSMPVDNYNLYSKFEPGRKVYVKLKGLFYAINHGAMVIGANYNGAVGRLSGTQFENIILRSCDKVDEETLVNHVTIGQSLNNSYINKLIQYDGVQLSDESLGKNYFDEALPSPGGSTNHTLEALTGPTVILRNSSYAVFAAKKVPTGSGSVRGVMTKFNSDFQFLIRTESDVDLNGPRLGEDPVDPTDPTDPEDPTGVMAFPGSDFEDYAAFLAGINSFGIKPYATQGTGAGMGGGNSLQIMTSGAAGNDYVFTSFARAGMPTTYTKLVFYVKGTSSKSLSINLYKTDADYYKFNLGDVTADKTVNQAASNQYTGTIDTGGNWVKITLDLTDIADLNTSVSGNFFALKVGSGQPYNLQLDNFLLQ